MSVVAVATNSFGCFVEVWAESLEECGNKPSFASLVGSLLPSCPSESATSRMKTVQSPMKTLARFVKENAGNQESAEKFLLPKRVQAKLRDDIDYEELYSFVRLVLEDCADYDESNAREFNPIAAIVNNAWSAETFAKRFTAPLMNAMLPGFDTLSAVKIRGHINSLNFLTQYGRFEAFSSLLFVALTAGAGIDEVIKAYEPFRDKNSNATPRADGFAAGMRCEKGFCFTQLCLDESSAVCEVATWVFGEGQCAVSIGREDSDIVPVPPSGGVWMVSRAHATVSRDSEGAFWIADDSLNGTAIRSVGKVSFIRKERFRINEGDVLMLAPSRVFEKRDEPCAENWEQGSVLRFGILRR